MKPFILNGDMWRVVEVPSGDPRLVDRLGDACLGTADPATRTIHISSSLEPPLLDKVLIHEVAHAITISYGLLDAIHSVIGDKMARVLVEEWAAQLVENHAIEAAAMASRSLGRSVCVDGLCHG